MNTTGHTTPDPPVDGSVSPDDPAAVDWVGGLLASQPVEVMPDDVADTILAALRAAQEDRAEAGPAPTSDPADLVALRALGTRTPHGSGQPSSRRRVLGVAGDDA